MMKGIAMITGCTGVIRTAACLAFAALAWPTAAFAADVAAVVEKDAASGKTPFDHILVWRGCQAHSLSDMRGCQKVPAETPLQRGDRVQYDGSAAGPAVVRIAMMVGGRSVALSASEPTVDIGCEPAALTDSMWTFWRKLPDVDRTRCRTVESDKSRLAASRGGEFSVPVLLVPQANLAAGKRRLYLAWQGGKAPYAVKLTRFEPYGVVLDWTRSDALSIVLPELDLTPGRYSLVVSNTVKEADKPDRLQFDNLYVLAPGELPAMPREISAATLTPMEKQLLYAFYLEELKDGRWTFEAQQRVAPYRAQSDAAADWLRKFGGE